MAFNVLKDPKDPRNFIVQPVPVGGADPSLLAAGQAAGQAGTLARPKRRPSAGFQSTAPGTGETQFGPGSEEAFARGLFNFRGRLNRKRFEQNKTVFEANLVRDGLNMNAPGVREALNEAYKSTNGFAAATDVAQDFFFNQPEQKQQRALDLDAIQAKEKRTSDKLLAETERIENENAVFKYDLGVPTQRVVEDRFKFRRRMSLADRFRDAMVLSEEFGTVRFGESTSSHKAALKRAYEDIRREITLGVGEFSDAGALGDVEREWFGEFAGEFLTLAPLQDSARRVALQDGFNFLQRGAEDIRQSNRALLMGARPVAWDLGDPRTSDQILAREVPANLTELNPQEIEVEAGLARERAEAAGEPAPPTTAEPPPTDDFFSGVEELTQGTPLAEQTPLGAVGTAVGGILEGASETAQQFTDEEERRQIRERAGR